MGRKMRMRMRKKRTRTRRIQGTKTRTQMRMRIQMKETRRPAVVHLVSKKVWGMGNVLQTCSSLARRKFSIIRRMENEPLKV